MNTFILIVILNVGAYSRDDNSHITMQEFKTLEQCEYAAGLIRKSANKIRALHCIYK